MYGLKRVNKQWKDGNVERISKKFEQWGEPLGQNHFNKRLKYYAEKAGIKGKKVTAHVYLMHGLRI